MSLFVLKPRLKLLLQWRCPWLMTASSHQWGEHEFLLHILLLLLDMQVVSVNLLCAPRERDCDCHLLARRAAGGAPLLVQGDLEPPEATRHPCSILAFFWDPLTLGYLVVCKKLLVSYLLLLLYPSSFKFWQSFICSNIIRPLEVNNKEYTSVCTGKSIFLNKFWYSYVH